MIDGNRIAIKYSGREYRIEIYPSLYGEGEPDSWDAMASFPKGETPDADEYAAFEKYLEDEGFVEQAMKYWSK